MTNAGCVLFQFKAEEILKFLGHRIFDVKTNKQVERLPGSITSESRESFFSEDGNEENIFYAVRLSDETEQFPFPASYMLRCPWTTFFIIISVVPAGYSLARAHPLMPVTFPITTKGRKK